MGDDGGEESEKAGSEEGRHKENCPSSSSQHSTSLHPGVSAGAAMSPISHPTVLHYMDTSAYSDNVGRCG